MKKIYYLKILFFFCSIVRINAQTINDNFGSAIECYRKDSTKVNVIGYQGAKNEILVITAEKQFIPINEIISNTVLNEAIVNSLNKKMVEKVKAVNVFSDVENSLRNIKTENEENKVVEEQPDEQFDVADGSQNEIGRLYYDEPMRVAPMPIQSYQPGYRYNYILLLLSPIIYLAYYFYKKNKDKNGEDSA